MPLTANAAFNLVHQALRERRVAVCHDHPMEYLPCPVCVRLQPEDEDAA